MRFFITAVVLFGCVGSLFAQQTTIWIGTSKPAGVESKGIYRATLDIASGKLSEATVAAEIVRPGFLALHPQGGHLYAVCQLPEGQGGGVAAFEIVENGSALRFLNSQPIGDGGAAHLTVDQSGKYLFTAQYGGGSVALFSLDADGRILPRRALMEHEGSGPNTSRQKGPHPHWVGVDPANRFLFVPDLGIDRVMVYRLDHDAGTIRSHGFGRCPPGSGPRHMKFHPNGKLAYVLNELELSITAFRYDAAEGTLDPFETVTTLPEALQEVPNSASEIRIHPSGRFVYAANRGHDSIAVFQIDADSGKLTFVEHESIRGSWPRNFNLDPTGRWLLAAGGKSNTIALFEIDAETGRLTYTGKSIFCPAPICIAFQPLP